MNNGDVSDVTELASAISEYGVMAVLLAIFLVLFLVIIISVIRNNQKHIDNLMTQNKENTEIMKQQQQSLIDNLMLQQKELLSSSIKQIISTPSTPVYNEKNIVEIFVKLNDLLKADCKSTQEEINADRVSIYVFHNGTTSSHGIPFFKMSCISEFIIRGHGLSSKLIDHTNLPLNMFDTIISQLFNTGEFIITNNEKNKSSDPISYIFIGPKVNTCILESIFDSDNNMLGFVCGEFRTELTHDELDEKIKALNELCSKIKPVLEFSDYQEIQTRRDLK